MLQDGMTTPGMMGADAAPPIGIGPQVAPVMAPEEKPDVIKREAPEVSPARRALVKQKLKLIKAAKAKHEKAFKRMLEDQDFAYKWGVGKQWENQTEEDQRYIANIVQRHINTRVAALYAKDPTVIAKPTKRRYFKVWDGEMSTLQQAQQAIQAAVMPQMPMAPPGAPPGAPPAPGAPPQAAPAPLPPMMPVMAPGGPPQWAIDVMQDFQQGLLRKQMVKNVGETLEILFRYFMKEQVPDFKDLMKQLVRRTEVCGVGYVKVSYQRLYGKRPTAAARIADIVDQMQAMDRMRADLLDKEIGDNDAEMEELRLTLKELQSEPDVVVREGPVWDFPTSTRIIVDPRCRQLQGFVGARWIAEEIDMTPNEIKEVFAIDIKASTPESNSAERTANLPKAIPGGDSEGDDEKPIAVYYLYDRSTGLKYCFTEDYQDFLAEPAAPDIKLERFFPYYALVFNAIEHEKELYPPSDVRLLRSQQIEYNRIKEALRQHRIANRPLYVTPAGALEDEDKEGQGQMALDNYPAHAVLEIQGLADDQDIKTKLQPVPKVPVDPNLYESEGIFNDMERVSGSAEANLGGTTGGKTTATESNISEGSRLSSLESNADDLDSLLTQMARDGGQVLLAELATETAIEIAGEGAVWPEMSRSDIAKEIYLDIEAGSSGRPNRARDIANFKDMGPMMMQIPGTNPEAMARYAWRVLDDKVDLTDMLMPGMPSITALNGNMQLGTGDANTDPNQQGAQGAQNAPAPPPMNGPGPQVPTPAALS